MGLHSFVLANTSADDFKTKTKINPRRITLLLISANHISPHLPSPEGAARGGKGIRNYDAAKDKVAAVKIVDDVDDVLLSSQEGIIIRLHANEIPLQSRYGSGVRVMRLGENDKVMVLARTDHDDEAQTEQIDTSDADAEPTAEQLAAMEAADAAAAAEAPEADDKGEE